MADLDIRVIDENGVTIRHLEFWTRPLATRDGCEISSEVHSSRILTHHIFRCLVLELAADTDQHPISLVDGAVFVTTPPLSIA